MVGLIAAAAALEASNSGLRGLLDGAPSSLDWGLAGALAIVFGVQKLVPTYEHGWYKALKKPEWTPPNYVFPLVWVPLKMLQSAALWLVCKAAPTPQDAALPVALFGLHLFLGNWWNVVFFGRHEMKASTRWMAAFWASIAGSIAAFSQLSPLAALLFAPTQVWVTIAAKLNWDIVQLNSGGNEAGKKQK